jgi:rhodanese-related sulfurtransferase
MTLHAMILRCIGLALLALSSTLASAAGEKHGIELKELDALLKSSSDQIIFIDVRDPVEIMFTGFTDAVDSNIPYQTVDRNTWNEKKGVFMMRVNPNFVADVEALLKQKGLSKDAQIVTMCRSGSARGKPSAEFLRENGFAGAQYLIHGFQGSSTKKGGHMGMRVKNGWQNSGMPWQKKPNPEKIYRK